MMADLKDQLAALAAIHGAATPGLLRVDPVATDDGTQYATSYEAWVFLVAPNSGTVAGLWANKGESLADAISLAAAHNALPALLRFTELVESINDNVDLECMGRFIADALATLSRELPATGREGKE